MVYIGCSERIDIFRGTDTMDADDDSKIFCKGKMTKEKKSCMVSRISRNLNLENVETQ